MNWLNEPQTWTETERGVTLRTEPNTDFWRITHDGGVRDTGHFFYETVEGDCTLHLRLEGDFSGLYDHAGVMLRLSETHWIKSGIEFFEGEHWRSVVVTRDYSDWALVSQGHHQTLWLRAVRKGHTVEIAMSEDGEDYALFRQAYFPADGPLQVGMMAASPKGAGFEARFSKFSIE